MTALTLVLPALLALAWRGLRLELDVAGWDRLWRVASGPVAMELRRNAGMARLAGDSLAYPLPREFRTLLVRVGGVPVWSRQSIVSLPGEVDARIADIPAGEFDHLFSEPFRLARPRSTLYRLHSVRH